MKPGSLDEARIRVLDAQTSFFVKIDRSFGSSTVHFGPFDSVGAATAWLSERGLSGLIVGLNSPETATDAFAEVWVL